MDFFTDNEDIIKYSDRKNIEKPNFLISHSNIVRVSDKGINDNYSTYFQLYRQKGIQENKFIIIKKAFDRKWHSKIVPYDDLEFNHLWITDDYLVKSPTYKPKTRIERTLEGFESDNKYPYRFKTEKEFIKEFGEEWMYIISCIWDSGMNYLFGQDFEHFPTYDEENLKNRTDNFFYMAYDGKWAISWDMLTPNIKPKPTYKPRTRVERTLESNTTYPYRFKTEQEFEEEYGEHWRKNVKYHFIPEMDHLLGKIFPYDIDKKKNPYDLPDKAKFGLHFTISWDMLTPNDKNKPSYKPKEKPKRLLEDINNKILYIFDFDNTLVYGDSMEEKVKHLISENKTPEDILKDEVKKIGVNLSDLKYENGRIFFKDAEGNTNIPFDSSWVRKKDRVYLVQPESYYLTDESMPTGVYQKIVDIYNSVNYNMILTARREKMRDKVISILNKFNISIPTNGLFMYPNSINIFSTRWKAEKILEVYRDGDFTEIHYYDDNIKQMKKIMNILEKYNLNIYYYKVDKNKYHLYQ